MPLFQFDQKSLPAGFHAAYNDLSIILMSQLNVNSLLYYFKREKSGSIFDLVPTSNY
jgi:hypothetical protein